MHAAVRGALAVLLLLGTAPRVDAQTSEPLRKTDLIRLLSGGALSHREIADLIGRNCVSFTPTARDRTDLGALGADSLILSRIATCRRSQDAQPAAPLAPTTPAPAAAVVVPLQTRVTVEAGSEAIIAVAVRRGGQPTPGVRLVLRGRGGVAGTGRRGVVGRRTAVPLIFEVRDSAGAPIPGLPVALSVANGRLLSPPDHTDSAGAVRVDLEFGPRAAVTTVTATLGAIVRQATLYPAPGPAARLLVLRGRDTVTRRLELDPDAPSNRLVIPTDAFGNLLPVRGLLAAVGDGRVLKVVGVTTDSLGGHVTLRPGRDPHHL